jgi:hypothetical protein
MQHKCTALAHPLHQYLTSSTGRALTWNFEKMRIACQCAASRQARDSPPLGIQYGGGYIGAAAASGQRTDRPLRAVRFRSHG